MQTNTNASVVLMTAILTAGLCLASVLAGISVGTQTPSHKPVSSPAQSIAAVEVNSRGPSAGGNFDADWDIEGYGAAIPTDLSIARVYFQ